MVSTALSTGMWISFLSLRCIKANILCQPKTSEYTIISLEKFNLPRYNCCTSTDSPSVKLTDSVNIILQEMKNGHTSSVRKESYRFSSCLSGPSLRTELQRQHVPHPPLLFEQLCLKSSVSRFANQEQRPRVR